MAKLFTYERDGFGMRAELAGKLDALLVDWRSYFAKRLAANSTTTTT